MYNDGAIKMAKMDTNGITKEILEKLNGLPCYEHAQIFKEIKSFTKNRMQEEENMHRKNAEELAIFQKEVLQ